MRHVMRGFLILTLVCGVAQNARAVNYVLDDGSGEITLGSGESHIAWLNAFQVVAGGEKITQIDIAFGANGTTSPPPDGFSVTAHLWTDPTNDGNPGDAIVASSAAGVIASSHTDTFISFVLPTPVTLAVTDWFFVGFDANTLGTGMANFAVSRDTNSDAGRSWVAVSSIGALDLNNLSAAGVFLNFDDFLGGNALIRARAEAAAASAVPEPATFVLAALGLLGLGFVALRKKFRQA